MGALLEVGIQSSSHVTTAACYLLPQSAFFYQCRNTSSASNIVEFDIPAYPGLYPNFLVILF